MKLKKFGALLLTGVLAITSLTTSAFAAKREKRSADDIDFAAVLEDTSAKGTVNVYHWWTAGGEKDAIESVIDEFKGAYGKVKTKSNAIPGGAGGAMVMKVKVLQQAGKSPETFQAHPGQEIQPYLDANMLLDLSKLWDYAKLNERILPGIKDLLTAPDGKNYVVPIGIHKTNVIFYNIHVFEKYGIAIPDHENITWDEFWDICDQLAAKMPDGEYPIDLGDRKGWPACQVFEDIMMGTDPKIYQDFINGIYNVEDVTKVLTTYYWNAVLYGLWFGLLTAAGMLLDPQFRKIRKRVTAHQGGVALMKAFGWLRTMAAVLLAQFFACTTSPGMAFGMMGRIFTDFGAGMTRNFPLGMQDGAVAIIAVLLMLLVDILCEKQPDLHKKLAVSPLYVRWTLLMGLMFLTLIFGCYGAGFDRAAFLYAGF